MFANETLVISVKYIVKLRIMTFTVLALLHRSGGMCLNPGGKNESPRLNAQGVT